MGKWLKVYMHFLPMRGRQNNISPWRVQTNHKWKICDNAVSQRRLVFSTLICDCSTQHMTTNKALNMPDHLCMNYSYSIGQKSSKIIHFVEENSLESTDKHRYTATSKTWRHTVRQTQYIHEWQILLTADICLICSSVGPSPYCTNYLFDSISKPIFHVIPSPCLYPDIPRRSLLKPIQILRNKIHKNIIPHSTVVFYPVQGAIKVPQHQNDPVNFQAREISTTVWKIVWRTSSTHLFNFVQPFLILGQLGHEGLVLQPFLMKLLGLVSAAVPRHQHLLTHPVPQLGERGRERMRERERGVNTGWA